MEISKANSASSFRWKKMGIDSMFIRSRFFDSADRNLNETRFDRADIRMIDACQQSQWYLSVDILKCTGEMLITRISFEIRFEIWMREDRETSMRLFNSRAFSIL